MSQPGDSRELDEEREGESLSWGDQSAPVALAAQTHSSTVRWCERFIMSAYFPGFFSWCKLNFKFHSVPFSGCYEDKKPVDASAAPVLKRKKERKKKRREGLQVWFPEMERVALQAGNRSVEGAPVGCGEQGNLSVEVTDYNASCNSSVLPRPAARARGKTPSAPRFLLLRISGSLESH